MALVVALVEAVAVALVVALVVVEVEAVVVALVAVLVEAQAEIADSLRNHPWLHLMLISTVLAQAWAFASFQVAVVRLLCIHQLACCHHPLGLHFGLRP